MSWLFSRVLVEEYSAGTCSDGEPCAQLNVMPTPHPFWHNDRTTDVSRLSRFGLTSRALTEPLGKAVLTSYLAAFPARTSAQPDEATGSPEREADSGERWHGSLARYDRDSSSWRTPQCSLLGDSESFSATWPRWGSMRNGECSQRLLLAPTISESASGFWPTPNVPNGGRTVHHVTDWRGKSAYYHGKKVQVGLEAAVQFATPQSRDYRSGQAERWDNPARSRNLNDQIAKFPTPTVAMHKGSSGGAMTRKSGKSRENDRLDYKVEQGDSSLGRLNPMWVEWLMGWPEGWTALEPLATDKFREWSSQHGDCYPSGQE